MNVPNRFQFGNFTIKAVINKINEILEYLKSQRIVVDNKGIIRTETPNGVVLKVGNIPTASSSGGSETIVYANPLPAIVDSGNDVSGYNVSVYPNGYDDPTGRFAAVAFIIQGNSHLSTIPVGAKIMIYPYNSFMQTIG